MAKAGYVDGYVFPVPKKKTAAYKKICAEARAAWMRYGALDYKECIIEDSNPYKAAYTFNTMVKPKAGEAVWFSFVVYKSKAQRNAVNKKVMAYFAKKYGSNMENMQMPMDPKRMATAGFKVVVG